MRYLLLSVIVAAVIVNADAARAAEQAGVETDPCFAFYQDGMKVSQQLDYNAAIQKLTEARTCLLAASNGEETADTAALLTVIGGNYYALKDYERTLENFNMALAVDIKVLGEESPEAATVYANTGVVYADLGDYARALENYEKALRIRIKVLGEDNPDTATSYNDAGDAYAVLGEFTRALENYNKALRIRIKVLGEDNPDTAMSYSKIGLMYFDLSDYAHALENYDKALRIRIKVLGEDNPDTATSYNDVGIMYADLGNYARALENYKKALEIRLKIYGEENPDTAISYNNVGMAYDNLGEYARALENHKKALEIKLKIYGDENPDTAVSYNHIGIVYADLGDNARALENYNKALEIRLKVYGEENLDTAASYNNVGIMYADLGDYPRALESHNKALEIKLKIHGEDNLDTAQSYNSLGVAYADIGDFARALENHNKALKIRLKILGEDNHDVATSYNNIGIVYFSLGSYERALDYFKKALSIDLKVNGKDHPDTATDYNNIGQIYDSQGDYERALENYNKSLEISIKTLGEEHPDTATCYNNLGMIYEYMGDHERALEDLNKALAVDLKVYGRDNPKTAAAYNNLGEVYDSLGEYERALDNYNKALAIDRIVFGEDHEFTASTYNNLGCTYGETGDFKQALENYNKALLIDSKVFGVVHPKTAADYNNIGGAYASLEDYDHALENYYKALGSLCDGKKSPAYGDCRPIPDTVDGFRRVAEIYNNTNRLKESAEAYENAVAALDMVRESMSSEAAKKFQGAKYYEMFPMGIGTFASLAESGDTSAPERAFAFAEKGIGRVFLEMIGKSLAVVNGGLSKEVIDEGHRLKSEWLVALDAVNMEEGKSRDNVDLAARRAAYERFNKADEDLKAYEARLLIDYPDYAELTHPRTRSIAEIRGAVLAPSEAALEYITGEVNSWLILITSDNIRIVPLPPAEELGGLVSKMRYNIMPFDCSYPKSSLEKCNKDKTNDGATCKPKLDELKTCLNNIKADRNTVLNASIDKTRETGKQLYDMLIAPVEADLEGINKLLIVPTSDLYFLPFETLVPGGGTKYLAEKYDIRYAPSLNVMYLVANRRKERGGTRKFARNWLGFGDPVYQSECDERARGMKTDEDTALAMRSYTRALARGDEASAGRGGLWCRIPATGDEVKAISGIFKSDETSSGLNLGMDANEARFKQLAPLGSRYIHLACHGTLGDSGQGDGDMPALVLSLFGNEGTGEDGFLKMTEVLNTKAPAEMIVLSACETGRGRMERGEGVAGMARAFLYSGADSLLVSLWSVDDENTKKLMVDFYDKLRKGTDKESAITEARRDMINNGLAPFYWAPFVFIGAN